MPNSFFSAPGWELTPRAFEQLPSPTLRPDTGQGTGDSESRAPQSLSCPRLERAPGVCQAAATSTSDIRARRGEGGKLLLLLMLKASDAVVSPWVGQGLSSSPSSCSACSTPEGHSIMLPPQNPPGLHLPRLVGSCQCQVDLVGPETSLCVSVALASLTGCCRGPGALCAMALVPQVTRPQWLTLSPGKP